MYTKLFIYKLLVNLKTKIKTININDLYSIHSDFINTLEIYNLLEYAKKFHNSQNFVFSFIYTFGEFELGIYKNNTLIFDENPLIIEPLINYEIDVNDKLINEMAVILSIYLNDINKDMNLTHKKQL